MKLFKTIVKVLFFTIVFYLLIAFCDAAGLLDIPNIVYSIGGIITTYLILFGYTAQFAM